MGVCERVMIFGDAHLNLPVMSCTYVMKYRSEDSVPGVSLANSLTLAHPSVQTLKRLMVHRVVQTSFRNVLSP